MTDSNRGRDLPRGQQYVRDAPKGGRAAEQIKTLKRHARVKKALAKIISDGGYNSLFHGHMVATEKTKSKKRTVVIDALAIGEHVPKLLLEHLGLVDEPNPTTNCVDDGKAPF